MSRRCNMYRWILKKRFGFYGVFLPGMDYLLFNLCYASDDW